MKIFSALAAILLGILLASQINPAAAATEPAISAFISITRSELYAGQRYTATASIYTDAPATVTARLNVPAGLIIRSLDTNGGCPPSQVHSEPNNNSTAVELTLDYNCPFTVSYLIEVPAGTAPGAPTDLELIATDNRGNYVRSATTVRVCCLPVGSGRRSTWLPFIRR